MIRRLLTSLLVLSLFALPAQATWSIVVVNRRTGEIAIASATCLPNTNLLKGVPVIVSGVGAAAAQSVIDQDGSNRILIFASMGAGFTPEEILEQLALTDSDHDSRQYGIVTLAHPPISFTGGSAGRAKKSVAGEIGDLAYAVQGNVLTGKIVVDAARDALLATDGDLGQKVMAAMEAARALGGDGRCSCPFGSPTSCGAPPEEFEKSAHVGFIVVSRMGDTQGTCSLADGCATGKYYLRINVRGSQNDPDPVLTMHERYAEWRADRSGRPDGILSTVTTTGALHADGTSESVVTVQLVDIDGTPLDHGGADVRVSGVGGARAHVALSGVTDHGDGSYSFSMTAGTQPGTDRLVITATDDLLTATLYPYLEAEVLPLATLQAGVERLSALDGGTVPLIVEGRPRARYLMLATLSGTVPGFDVGPLHFALNPDRMTLISLRRANDEGFLPDTRGFLDADGRGAGALIAPRGLFVPLIGMRMDWVAWIVGHGPPLVTNAAGFEIVR